MKKKMFIMLTVLLSVGLFTACSSDDKEDDPREVLKNQLKELDGDYKAEDVVLNYGGSAMLGVDATFSVNDLKGVITLYNAIPGEQTTDLEVDFTPIETRSKMPFSVNFEGEDKNADRTITYKGAIQKDQLTLDLDVEFTPQDVMGKWELAEEPVHMEWTVDGGIELLITAGVLKQVLPGMISQSLETVLKSIDLRADGDIIAEYSEAGAETIDFKPSTPNLAHYYVKDGKLFALLNVEMITAEVSKTRSVATLLGMLENGIPVDYTVDPNKTLTLTVNHELINLALDAIDELGVSEEFFAIAEVVVREGMLNSGLYDDDEEAIDALIGMIPDLWENTTKFEIGLNMVAAN